jgi:membrane-bound metal-dependent hydrolase YbcI (DUF457 family)
MPDAKAHIVVAAGVGIVGYILYCAHFRREFMLSEALVATGVCVLGGIAPDGLEPALSPCHRSLGHSLGAGLVGANTLRGAWAGTTPGEPSFLLLFFALGYVTHLIMDAGTPKRLPLLW